VSDFGKRMLFGGVRETMITIAVYKNIQHRRKKPVLTR
jgi:hypothetical protein